MNSTATTDYTTFTGWIDPPTDIPPPLKENLTCSVAVIGGGLAGLSTARRLAGRGVDTVLLESGCCGYGPFDTAVR
ncbi:FAD-dependent oxidoreductase [Mycobacterium aquaticum]|uniref:FAD-dependent oxidoreductase n=1 Tax=Mycobacterium aquaticum TaxID=1927124 RepID=UPI001150B548|nr:FAD-dependent oxidoreductase [Mycobacterium aquaticum]